MSEASPFWRRVRELRKEIAIELFMQDQRRLGVFNTPETRGKFDGFMEESSVCAGSSS